MVAAKPTQGFVNIHMQTDARDVMSMLSKLERAMEPSAIAVWLGTVVDPYIRKRARNRFKTEGDDVSGKWAPLLGPTQYFRASQGFSPEHPINVRTGALEAYITGSPNRLSVTPAGATLTLPGKAPKGTMYSKVKTAQRGQLNPHPTVPRPVLGVNERDLGVVLTELSLYFALRQNQP